MLKRVLVGASHWIPGSPLLQGQAETVRGAFGTDIRQLRLPNAYVPHSNVTHHKPKTILYKPFFKVVCGSPGKDCAGVRQMKPKLDLD